jgi:hypothetical protein
MVVLIGIMMKLANKWLRLRHIIYGTHIAQKYHGKIYSASRLKIGLTN